MREVLFKIGVVFFFILLFFSQESFSMDYLKLLGYLKLDPLTDAYFVRLKNGQCGVEVDRRDKAGFNFKHYITIKASSVCKEDLMHALAKDIYEDIKNLDLATSSKEEVLSKLNKIAFPSADVFVNLCKVCSIKGDCLRYAEKEKFVLLDIKSNNKINVVNVKLLSVNPTMPSNYRTMTKFNDLKNEIKLRKINVSGKEIKIVASLSRNVIEDILKFLRDTHRKYAFFKMKLKVDSLVKEKGIAIGAGCSPKEININ